MILSSIKSLSGRKFFVRVCTEDLDSASVKRAGTLVSPDISVPMHSSSATTASEKSTFLDSAIKREPRASSSRKNAICLPISHTNAAYLLGSAQALLRALQISCPRYECWTLRWCVYLDRIKG